MTEAAKSSSSRRVRGERLETRVTVEQKRLIEDAAALQGRTVTDFVLSSVQEAARRAIEDHQQLALSMNDARAIVDALAANGPANERLRDTIRRYRQRSGA